MAEQTFRSPGFFDREIDLTERQVTPTGVPAGVIGTSEKGPAFTPITVASYADFQEKFGKLDRERFGPYAVNEFLKNRTACTFVRVLGAGANETSVHINLTKKSGVVRNAGFVISGTDVPGGPTSLQRQGTVQFITAIHYLSSGLEPTGFPIFTDNNSFSEATSSGQDEINLVRAVIFTATGTCMQMMHVTQSYNTMHEKGYPLNAARIFSNAQGKCPANTFKLVLSNSDGASFGSADHTAGIKVFTASLDPNSQYYISKILNTDPHKFNKKKHLLYLDFPVDNELAPLAHPIHETGENQVSVALMSGSGLNSHESTVLAGLTFEEAFGRFDTRYTVPKTTPFISQPFADKEYNLFHFETISDGQYANTKYKVSIANIQASTDEKNPYGTFEIQVRDFYDTDADRKIIERYPNCNLDPDSDRFIGKIIGDKRAEFNFDATRPEERRLIVKGKYPNLSKLIRVIIDSKVQAKQVPAAALPFGFRGISVLKTSDSLTDRSDSPMKDGSQTIGASNDLRPRLFGSFQRGIGTTDGTRALQVGSNAFQMTASIIPPLPYRFKVTRGDISQDGGFLGQPGQEERADTRFYWGVQNTRLAKTGTFGPGKNEVLRPNEGTEFNRLVDAYTKFQGITKLDTLVTGTGADLFNDNKFTMARVVLPNSLDAAGHISNITGSVKDHMKGAAYVRNGRIDSSDYTIENLPVQAALGSRRRITLATLLNSSSVIFNRFANYNKFTNIFHGGFDGLNILDKDVHYMNDKASSMRAGGGKAATDFTDSGLGEQGNLTNNPGGSLTKNNVVSAYLLASKILTNPLVSNINILAVPGIRDETINSRIMQDVKDFQMAFFVMDVPTFDDAGNRLYDGSKTKGNVRQTTEALANRTLDNNYAGAYWPDVFIQDDVNNSISFAPASVAALGALGYNDNVRRPWYAPAGFDRGALDSVMNVKVRLSTADRDMLYDGKINPIATFPDAGFVIFGQKTLQSAQSALDRINVRRMLLEVKRLVVGVARRLLFEQNTPATRARFIAGVTPLLAIVQAQQGIEQFRVVMDDTNNATSDIEANRLNGRIVVVPTRAVEFIAVDFIITNTGVSFEE